MDVYPNATSWLQQTSSQQAALQSDAQASQRHPSDWKDAVTPNGSGASTSNPQAPFDLSEFVLGDLSTPPSSASPLSSPSAFFGVQNNFLFPPGPSAYNAMTYGAPSWANQPGQVPLSNYSTLNGATSHGVSSSSHQSAQAIIDPALTTLSTPSASLNYSHPAPTQSQPQPQSMPRNASQYSYSHLPMPSSLSPTLQFQYQSAPATPSLHTPQPLSSIPPASFYHSAPAPAATAASPPAAASPATSASTSVGSAVINRSQGRREAFLSALKTSLQAKGFSGARGVQQLVSQIADYGIADVDGATRLEVVTKIRDNAGNHYFRAWVENTTAMDITREWLKAGATGSADSQVQETIMPLLHITDRLPFTPAILVASKLGKIVRKLAKDAPLPAVKDMASNLERKWRDKYLSQQPDEDAQDPKSKKRKPADPPSKSAPPAKKLAVAAAASSSSSAKSSAARKDVRSSLPLKDSKSDSSFFSAPKPKAKLPSFKKAPAPPAKKEPEAAIAQPSAVDPFQEALKDMAKARKPSPAAAHTPPAAAGSAPAVTGLTKLGKKKKSVTWPADSHLEQVKLIDKAIYDDDPVDGTGAQHNLRDLDRDEGAALHAHLFEELIDWIEPSSLEVPPEMAGSPQRGEQSREKITQEEREQTALGAMYLSQHIPESPAEPTTQISLDQVDANIVTMLTGVEADLVFWPAVPLDDPMMDASMAEAGPLGDDKNLAFDPNAIAQMTGNLPPEQLQQIAALFAQSGAGAGAFGTEQNWDAASFSAYFADGGAGRDRWPDEEGGWRGGARGRGRGRGRPGVGEAGFRQNRSRIPCSFFAQGRCRYGDQCDFSHEPNYS
ncbi:hypothetical protein FA95DRAFT_1239507 [Auriscalpium vulgare]|uniref:Uncharacterized protein n=1 Tax=Auriscalpium vulgare TaxID=40419 RepID=A0ACB8S7M8_9AGAM|nr:hypothetical protein FA95DRAFT_1239507 [Auriscalpium vulgare]